MSDEQYDDKGIEIELIDLGDAAIETRQLGPGIYPDCLYNFGAKWGCGG